jgi:hypothetical protein
MTGVVEGARNMRRGAWVVTLVSDRSDATLAGDARSDKWRLTPTRTDRPAGQLHQVVGSGPHPGA